MPSRTQKKAVLLASGGLDSTVLAYWLRNRGIEFQPLFIDYGQHSRKTELSTLKKVLPSGLAKKIKVICLAPIYEESNSRLIKEPNLWRDKIEDSALHLPHRNLLILAAGIAFAESRGIYELYAAFIETHRALGSDCNESFFILLGQILSKTGNVKLRIPFSKFSKAQVAKIGLRLHAPLDQTYSCLAASRVPCGACPNCVDRLNAINSLG